MHYSCLDTQYLPPPNHNNHYLRPSDRMHLLLHSNQRLPGSAMTRLRLHSTPHSWLYKTMSNHTPLYVPLYMYHKSRLLHLLHWHLPHTYRSDYWSYNRSPHPSLLHCLDRIHWPVCYTPLPHLRLPGNSCWLGTDRNWSPFHRHYMYPQNTVYMYSGTSRLQVPQQMYPTQH